MKSLQMVKIINNILLPIKLIYILFFIILIGSLGTALVNLPQHTVRAQEGSETSTSDSPSSCDASCGTNDGSNTGDAGSPQSPDASLPGGLPDNGNGQSTDNSSPPPAQQESNSIGYTVPGVIPEIKQPSRNSCWATATTIMQSWKDQTNYEIDAVMNMAGPQYLTKFKNDEPLQHSEYPEFLAASHLVGEPPASYSINDYLRLLKEHGPLWITTSENPDKPFSTHARILKDIFGDGTPGGTYFVFIDPAYGTSFTETFDEFNEKLAQLAGQGGQLFTQIIHF